jgi:hypothetical protein
LSKKSIVLRNVLNHVYVERVIYDLNPILLSKDYKPLYYFEGSPQVSEGGLIVTIKLSRELSREDRDFIKRLVELIGFTVVEER